MTKNTADKMNKWDMVLSIYAALEKALEKAAAEREALQVANPDNPFATGLSTAIDIERTLNQTLDKFGYEIHRIARSNGLPEGTVR